ncbi:hypothetical protein GF407_13060 [candidate division KSB1 bacterium]|nr:hypothetical protein [candidate division KSB1 bacterium]
MQQRPEAHLGNGRASFYSARQHLEAAKIYLSENYCFEAMQSASQAFVLLAKAMLSERQRRSDGYEEIVAGYANVIKQNGHPQPGRVDMLKKAIQFLQQQNKVPVSAQQAELFIGAAEKIAEEIDSGSCKKRT